MSNGHISALKGLNIISAKTALSSNFYPSHGDFYFDDQTQNSYMWDDNKTKWRAVSPASEESKKWKRLIPELEGEDLVHIVETLLLLMMKNGIVKDINEFKEFMKVAKMTNQLEEE